MRVLVTGAAGFVGRHLLELLEGRHEVVAALLNEGERANLPEGVECHVVGDIGANPNWEPVLKGVDGVVHLAARAHILDDRHPDPAGEFDRINHLGTVALADAAARAGVKRFVFISTIGVNGDGQGLHYSGAGYSETDAPAPHNAYAQSKLAAEAALAQVSTRTSMEYAIVRPPLVYGAGVPGNFFELLKWVQRGTPLPFGGVKNRRSMVGVRNLADFLVALLERQGAANQLYVISDGRDLSTPELFLALGPTLGKSGRLPSAPLALVKLMFTALGKGRAFHQLCGNLVVDSRKAREELGWTPPVSVEDGLKESAQWFANLSSR